MKIVEYSITFNRTITAADIKNADSINIGMLEQVAATVACWHSMTTDGEVETIISKIREMFPEVAEITILAECGEADEYGYCPYLEEVSRTVVKINGEEQAAAPEQKAEEPTTAEQQTEEQAEPEEQTTEEQQQQLRPRKPGMKLHTFKQLVGMLADDGTTAEKLDEIAALTDLSYQHDKITAKDHETIYCIINKLDIIYNLES